MTLQEKLDACVDKQLQAEQAMKLILAEYHRATRMYPPMASAAEGWATIYEEVDELWEHVKKKPRWRDIEAMREEAVQIGAMALRFITDVTGVE